VPELKDILLSHPLPSGVMNGLLFVLFTLHMLFVLLAVGTAILAVYFVIRERSGLGAAGQSWSEQALRTFMAHKSLAVVLGVGPLLLIQSGLTLPFFTAVNFVAPWWLLIIGLLIVAFLALDGLGQHPGMHPQVRLSLGLVGLASLLAVPGIFVATLVTTENPSQWLAIARNGYALPRALSWHWLLRYLHVLGGAVVFAGVFQYLTSRRDDAARRASLYRWVIAGVAFQVIVGVPLYISIPLRPDLATNMTFATGVAAVAAMFMILVWRRSINARVIPVFLAAILLLMLLTRQFTQYRGTLPVQRDSAIAAAAYAAQLNPYRASALARYRTNLENVRDTGESTFAGSCAFCHGANAKGDGVEAAGLSVRPEDLTAVRTTRAHLNHILLTGIPGAAMPKFAYLNWGKVNAVTDYLNGRYHVLGKLEPVTTPVSAAAYSEAQRIWLDTCILCHGMNGTADTSEARNLRPAPPDFTVYTINADRAFRVISDGYPGAGMPSFVAYPAEVRWGLVKVVHNFYTPQRAAGPNR
jgi:mono/diheme cytochrome c family protein